MGIHREVEGPHQHLSGAGAGDGNFDEPEIRLFGRAIGRPCKGYLAIHLRHSLEAIILDSQGVVPFQTAVLPFVTTPTYLQ